MTHFPRPHERRRSTRVQLHSMVSAAIRFEDGRHSSGKLRTISCTGGLLRLPKAQVPGTLVEVIFPTPCGPVLGVAEMLSPVSATLKCLQPFKFIMIDDRDYQRLNALIAACGSASNHPTELKLQAEGTA